MQQKTKKGFTIIEVLIVLAIAGLIFAIVFRFIPQLRRNQRNSAFKRIVETTATELNNYASNNGGLLPDTEPKFADVTAGSDPSDDGFTKRYLSDVAREDPKGGNKIGYTFHADTTTQPSLDGATPYPRTIHFYINAKCSGETVVAGDGPRTGALAGIQEGGGIVCVDVQ